MAKAPGFNVAGPRPLGEAALCSLSSGGLANGTNDNGPHLWGLGAAGAIQAGIGQSAARQKYASDLAFQSANNRFSVWQAGFNAQVKT